MGSVIYYTSMHQLFTTHLCISYLLHITLSLYYISLYLFTTHHSISLLHITLSLYYTSLYLFTTHPSISLLHITPSLYYTSLHLFTTHHSISLHSQIMLP